MDFLFLVVRKGKTPRSMLKAQKKFLVIAARLDDVDGIKEVFEEQQRLRLKKEEESERLRMQEEERIKKKNMF